MVGWLTFRYRPAYQLRSQYRRIRHLFPQTRSPTSTRRIASVFFFSQRRACVLCSPTRVSSYLLTTTNILIEMYCMGSVSCKSTNCRRFWQADFVRPCGVQSTHVHGDTHRTRCGHTKDNTNEPWQGPFATTGSQKYSACELDGRAGSTRLSSGRALVATVQSW